MIKQELVEKRNELDALNKKVKKIRDDCRSGNNEYDLMKTTELSGEDSRKRLDEFRKMLEKQTDLGEQVDGLVAAVKSFDTPDEPEPKKGLPHPEGRGEPKTLGQMFVNSKDFKSFQEGKIGPLQVKSELPMSIKTLMTTSAGFAPESVRTGEVVGYAVEPIRLFNAIPKGETNQAAVVYMEQTTRTQNAAEATEGTGALGESAFVWTERSVTVQLIGHWVPVTDQQLEDVPQIEGIIDQEMRAGILERLDYQLINGDGSAPDVLGFLEITGLLGQDALGEEIPDAFYKAMTQVMTTGKADPNLIFIHPLDWQEVRLMRTTDGMYIWGNPSEAGPMRLWGLPVVPTARVAQGTGGVGDFANYMKYFEKRGIVVEITDAHSDYFIYNKKAIRATVRGCFRWSRPAAFCKVTNLNA